MLKPRKRHEGDWWLPETPERVVKGALFVSPGNRPSLRLLGRLGAVDHLDEKTYSAVIHGRTSEGVDVTLVAGQEVSFDIGHKRKPSRSLVRGEAAFIGAHFHRLEEIAFTGLSVRYTYLTAWAFPSNALNARPSDGWTRVDVTSQVPPVGQPAVWNDMKISLELIGALPRIKNDRITVIQQAWITVDCDGERTYSELVQLIRRVGNFLSLGVSKGVQPIEIRASTPLSKMEDMDGNQYPIDVQVYDTAFLDPRREESISGWQMLFSYPSVTEEFGAMLTTWLLHSETLEPILNVYFATIQRNVYIEHRVLSFAQVLESYHRNVHGGTYMDAKEFRKTVYDKIKTLFPTDTSIELRNSILDRFRWAHEYTLRTRLSELLEHNREAVTKNIADWDRFVREVVATRNYLTHLGKANADVQITPDAMDELADYLQFVIEICLLRLTGLAPERIRRILDSDYRYNHAKRWSRYQVPASASQGS